MKKSFIAFVAFVSVVLCMNTVFAASVAESASPAFVFLQPEKTALWRTGIGKSFSIAIPYPPGVEKRATLSVTGYRYSATHSIVDEASFVLTLPNPAQNGPDKENVYSLTLTFADGSVKTATLGGIAGFDGSSQGTTRCLLSQHDQRWSAIKHSAVLPIPYGTETVKVNGNEIDTGLDGAAGWFLLAPLSGGTSYNLEIDGASAILNAYADGTVLVFR